jgi:hypothetical protein
MLPIMLVYLTGIVLTFVWWRRASSACMLALVGLLILLLTAFGSPAISWYTLNLRNTSQSVVSAAQWVMIVGLGLSLLRAVGTALLIAAIFAGRNNARVVGFAIEPTVSV